MGKPVISGGHWTTRVSKRRKDDLIQRSHTTDAYRRFKQSMEAKKMSEHEYRRLKTKEFTLEHILEEIKNSGTDDIETIVINLNTNAEIRNKIVNMVQNDVIDFDSKHERKINPENIDITKTIEWVYLRNLIEILVRSRITNELNSKYTPDEIKRILRFPYESRMKKISTEIQQHVCDIILVGSSFKDSQERRNRITKLKRETREIMKEVSNVLDEQERSGKGVQTNEAPSEQDDGEER